MEVLLLVFCGSKSYGIVRMWRSGHRREYMTRKTHVLGVIGRKQAENPRLKAGGGKWKRKVGAGANLL